MTSSEFPSPLYGSRLKLTLFLNSDITHEYLLWLNDPLVTKYSNQRFLRHSVETSTAFLNGFKGTNSLFLSIRVTDSNAMIGTMTAYLNQDHQTGDMGLLIGRRDLWGLGYGQEAWNALGTWLLETRKLRKLTAGTASENLGMRRIMERFGMHHEATKERQEIIDGFPQDLVFYAKFRS